MGTPRTMRSARWKREANSLIFSHVAVSTGVIDSPETPLYLALDCLRVELGKSLLPNIQPINCNVTNVLSKFREECIDDGGGCGFFLPRRGHYVQDIHVRCPSHQGCRGLKPVSDNMSRYVSLRWTGDGLSGETRPGWTVPLVREGELLLLGFTLSPHPRRPAASRISCVISSG